MRKILFSLVLTVLALLVVMAAPLILWNVATPHPGRLATCAGQIMTHPMPQGETEFPPLDVSFIWNPADLPARSLLLSTDEEPTVLQRVPAVPIRLTTNGPMVTIRSEPTVSAGEKLWEKLGFCYEEKVLPTTLLRMPDGSVHPQYHLLLQLEMSYRSLFHRNERAVALTELVIDPIDGTVDVVAPDMPSDKDKQLPHVRAVTQAQHVLQLPTRFCGSETEQSLQRYLFLVASMHNAESARRLLPTVMARGQKLVDTACDTDQDFPACWGEAADTARENHRRILPYLQRLQELDCFELPELADFINSPLFGHLFGDSWN